MCCENVYSMNGSDSADTGISLNVENSAERLMDKLKDIILTQINLK